MIIFCSNQKRNGSLVEASSLPIPFFNGVEGALSCEVEHKQNSDGVIAHQGQHIDELALAAEIPD